MGWRRVTYHAAQQNAAGDDASKTVGYGSLTHLRKSLIRATLADPNFLQRDEIIALSTDGFIIFMPWVTLPESVRVGRFRFNPIVVKDIEVGRQPEMVATIESALKCYVRKNGEPIESCTIVLRARHQQAWNIPRKHWDIAVDAAKTLALACLAEQRFFEGHFSPHLNGTMFRLIGQGVAAGSDQIAPFYPRRGGGLQIGGLRFKDIVFQRPPKSKAPIVARSTIAF